MASLAMSRASSRFLPSATKPGDAGTVTVWPPRSLASKNAVYSLTRFISKSYFNSHSGGDFSGGVGNGDGVEGAQGQNARAGSFRQTRDSDEEGQERDVAEGDRVAGRGERLERWN